MTGALATLAPGLPPRLDLGVRASPLEERPAVAKRLGCDQLLVKREDLNGFPFGGNKLRALEWLLPATGRAIVSMGGYGSTWCAALSAAAASVGRRAYPGLFPQPWSATVAGALATTIRHGQPVVARSRWGMGRALCNAFLLARRAGPVTWLPAGGACPLAVLGTIEAALEFADQCDAHGGFPEAVVVPLGSGGTAAGLLIGMWIVGRPVSVCAVRVTDPWFATGRRVLSLVRRTLRLLRGAGCRVAPGAARLRVVTDQLGRGYGAATPAATAACAEMAREGLPLDMTYGSKAWAALPGCAASFRRVCFWHTFDPRLACPPAVDHPLLRTARGYAEMLWPLRKST